MNKIKELSPLFTVGIFFVGFFALLLAGFNSMLNAKIEPLKENQVQFEERLNAKIEPLKENQAQFEERLNHIENKFEERFNRIEDKLDQVLIHKKAMAN